MKLSTITAAVCGLLSIVLFGDVAFGLSKGTPINSLGSVLEVLFGVLFGIYPAIYIFSKGVDFIQENIFLDSLFSSDDDSSEADCSPHQKAKQQQQYIDAVILLTSTNLSSAQKDYLGDILKDLVLRQNETSTPDTEVA